MSASTTSSVEHAGRHSRRPARFSPGPAVLVTSPVGWASTVAATLVVLSSSSIGQLSEATAADLAAMSGLLVLRGSVWLLACCWGGSGVMIVARSLLSANGRTKAYAIGSLVAGGLAILAAIGQLIIPLAATGFDAPTFGDTRAYANYLAASCLSIWLAISAVVLVALALHGAGIRRRAMIILAAVCAAYLMVDIATRGGVPPFAVAFVWLALGLQLRSSRVPA